MEVMEMIKSIALIGGQARQTNSSILRLSA